MQQPALNKRSIQTQAFNLQLHSMAGESDQVT